MSIEHNTELLIKAAHQGNTDDVRRLIPISDPKTNGSWALFCAAKNGHAECVELLIPVSNPKDDNSAALSWAVTNGHTSCVALLVPVSDCTVLNCFPLRHAASRKNLSCMELLFEHGDPHQTLEHLKRQQPQDTALCQFLEHFIAERQQRILHQALDTHSGHKTPARKM